MNNQQAMKKLIPLQKQISKRILQMIKVGINKFDGYKMGGRCHYTITNHGKLKLYLYFHDCRFKSDWIFPFEALDWNNKQILEHFKTLRKQYFAKQKRLKQKKKELQEKQEQNRKALCHKLQNFTIRLPSTSRTYKY